MYSVPARKIMFLERSPGYASAIFLMTSCANALEALPVGCSGSPMKMKSTEVGRVVKSIASSSAPNC